MKTIFRTRKYLGYLLLAFVLLIAADMYYPSVVCALFAMADVEDAELSHIRERAARP